MLRYVCKRILLAIPILFGISIIVYALASAAPGSPIDMFISNNSSMTAEAIAAMEQKMGLDKPVIVQYWNWLKAILSGDLGFSYRTYEPVWDMIKVRIGPTLTLTGTALVLSLLISIPLGALAAYKPYSVADYLSSGLSFLGAAMPNFFAAMVVVFFFSVKLGWLPASGMYNSLSDKSFSSLLPHLILPSCVLALQLMGGFLRQMRSSMLDSMDDDYVNTARAKGLRERAVVLIHVMRNSLIPLVSQIGLSIPLLIGGAVVTEQIFSWPGIGSLMVLSINNRDYPTIMGLTVVISVFVLLGNIVVDIVYGLLDPRIRYDGER